VEKSGQEENKTPEREQEDAHRNEDNEFLI